MAIAGRILIMPKGEWASETTYEMLDLVRHNNKAWLAKKTSVGIEPSGANDKYWHDLLGELTEFLPLSGGTMTGMGIHLNNGLGAIYTNESGTTGIISRVAESDSDNFRELKILPSSEFKASECLEFSETKDGIVKEYQIFGSHNKPNGIYKGNGSTTRREIEIGGTNEFASTLQITGNGYSFTVTPNGAYGINYVGQSMKIFSEEQCKYSEGVLTIATADEALNASEMTYYYKVL